MSSGRRAVPPAQTPPKAELASRLRQSPCNRAVETTPPGREDRNMASDMAEAHRQVKAVVGRRAGVRAGMRELVSYCDGLAPIEGLAALADLDFVDDRNRLRQWLVEVLTKEPPPEWIKAFWFGLADRADDDGTTCRLYVSGSTEYDPRDKAFSWASDPEYFPDRRHAPSRVPRRPCLRVVPARGGPRAATVAGAD